MVSDLSTAGVETTSCEYLSPLPDRPKIYRGLVDRAHPPNPITVHWEIDTESEFTPPTSINLHLNPNPMLKARTQCFALPSRVLVRPSARCVSS